MLNNAFVKPGEEAGLKLPGKPSRGLAAEVVDKISGQICSGELAPGVKLPTEQQMIRAYGVSRTVIREAISKLQTAGLVETRHGIGTFVLGSESKGMEIMAGAAIVTLHDVLDMLELRISLETQASGLAATRRTSDDLERLAGAMGRFVEQVRAGNSAVEEDLEFHLLICRATGNRYFEDVYRFMGQNTIPRTRIKTSQYVREPWDKYLMRTNDEHRAVFLAIERQDPESARAAMRMHLVNSRERLRGVLEIERRSGGE